MKDNGERPKSDSQDTGKKPRGVGVRFTKGDPRINRGGRPKSFEYFRALAQSIAAKEISDGKGNVITVGEAILRSWARSKEPQLQRAFIEYAYGKVPDRFDPLDGLGAKTTLILHYGHERDKRDADYNGLSSEVSRGAD